MAYMSRGEREAGSREAVVCACVCGSGGLGKGKEGKEVVGSRHVVM